MRKLPDRKVLLIGEALSSTGMKKFTFTGFSACQTYLIIFLKHFSPTLPETFSRLYPKPLADRKDVCAW